MSFKDECGVFGIWKHPEASRLAYLGLYALQHRGQESAGIVSLDLESRQHYTKKDLGLVADVFDEESLDQLKGTAAMGHVRYSTTGQNLIQNAQPLFGKVRGQPLALAHNGNLVNTDELRSKLEARGVIFQGTNDTECVLHMLAGSSHELLPDKVREVLPHLKGAYSFTLLNGQCLMAVRDPWGFRPLVLGRLTLPSGQQSVVIASETCAFDLIEAQYERDIEPGEMFWVDEIGEHSEFFAKESRHAMCSFEHVYFSRPDSLVFGQHVYQTRKQMGRWLAKEHAIHADLVIPVPDSGVPAAIGYSQESKIPFEMGIIRNHYVGRTFIEPRQGLRSFGVKVKLNPSSALIKGKDVIVVDDSLVRGTTCQKIISLVRQAGAKSVHLRISAPPTIGSCYYGVDTPKPEDLIANSKSIEQIKDFVNADTLAYLSMAGLRGALNDDMSGDSTKKYCFACFDRKYPLPPNALK